MARFSWQMKLARWENTAQFTKPSSNVKTEAHQFLPSAPLSKTVTNQRKKINIFKPNGFKNKT